MSPSIVRRSDDPRKVRRELRGQLAVAVLLLVYPAICLGLAGVLDGTVTRTACALSGALGLVAVLLLVVATSRAVRSSGDGARLARAHHRARGAVWTTVASLLLGGGLATFGAMGGADNSFGVILVLGFSGLVLLATAASTAGTLRHAATLAR